MEQPREIISYGHIENKLMYPHRNQGMELVLIERGHLEWAVDQVPEILTPGTVFFTLPWQTHGSLMLREPPNRIFYTLFALPGDHAEECDVLHFPESLQFNQTEEKALSDVFLGAHRHAWPATPLMEHLFRELIQRQGGETTLDAVAASSLLRTLLIVLADSIDRAQQAPQWLSPTLRKVKRFLSTVQESIDHAWTLEQMAARCDIKRTHFTNIVKQLTGYAPMQYLQRIRFDRACERLRNTKRPVTEIAFECGYASSQYFSESFRKQALMSPTEYRQSVPALDAIMQSNWDYPEWRTIPDEKRRAESMKHYPLRVGT